MGQLIDDLSHFSRTSRADLRRSAVLDLDHLVARVIRAAQPETVGRNIVWKKNPLPR